MNRCITVLQTAPLPLGYAASANLKNVLKNTSYVKHGCRVRGVRCRFSDTRHLPFTLHPSPPLSALNQPKTGKTSVAAGAVKLLFYSKQLIVL